MNKYFEEFSKVKNIADLSPRQIWEAAQDELIRRAARDILAQYSDDELMLMIYKPTPEQKESFTYHNVPSGLLRDELYLRRKYAGG